MNPGFSRVLLLRPALLAWALAGGLAVRAQAPADPAPGGPPPAEAPPAYTADQLDQMLGPIALYPDPLLALMLPSASAPAELVAAAHFLAAHGDPYDAVRQPWSDSVKALVHYPELVAWMAGNLTWVQAVGTAFASDPESVTQSIQRLRSRARDAGTLATTPQQEVVEEDGLLEIEPTVSNEIYVPRYDPAVVYLGPPDPGYGPFVTFGEPYPGGVWLNYGFDWRRHAIWVGRFTRDGRGWRRPSAFGPDVHPWRPAAGHGFAARPFVRPNTPVVRPGLLPGTPRPTADERARWENFHPPAGFTPAGNRLAHPGYPGGRPGGPGAFDGRAREREERDRAAHRGGAPGSPPAHPPARPPAGTPNNAAAGHPRAGHDGNDHDDGHNRPAR